MCGVFLLDHYFKGMATLEKYCPRCKQTKLGEEFCKSLKSKDGLASYCKTCKSDYKRKCRQEKTGFYATERLRYKLRVLSHYSQGNPRCCKCGYSDARALSIDHVNSDGAVHRRELKEENIVGHQFYRWIIRNHFPDNLQVLCMNCQFIKRIENNEFGGP